MLSAYLLGSLLRDPSVAAIKSFSWDAVAADLESHAPTLFRVLQGCVDVKSRSRSTRRASKRPNSTIALCVCGSILLRNRNARMNLLQRVVSILLNAGHASKQVLAFF